MASFSRTADNGSHFKGRVLDLFEEFGIEVHHSTTYRPQTNGAVEAANKNVEVIIKKTAESARDWHEQLPTRKEPAGDR